MGGALEPKGPTFLWMENEVSLQIQPHDRDDLPPSRITRLILTHGQGHHCVPTGVSG